MIEIPNKSLFKLNEVCSMVGVKPYVLRFWESEFTEISPITSQSGQKLYEHKDIEVIAIIKKLLFDDKLNIEQAKAEIRLAQISSNDIEEVDLPDLPTEEVKFDLEKLVLAKTKLAAIVAETQQILGNS